MSFAAKEIFRDGMFQSEYSRRVSDKYYLRFRNQTGYSEETLHRQWRVNTSPDTYKKPAFNDIE